MDAYTPSFYAEKMNVSESEIYHLMEYSKKHNVDFPIVYGLLYTETGGTFEHRAVGPQTRYGKAYGIAQFMENTAPWVASKAHLPYKDKKDLFDPVYSTKLAITYLHYLQYGDGAWSGYQNWHATLTAYNRGMEGLERYTKHNHSYVSSYSTKVLNISNELKF
ncbi:transglycosylase SLT domain-containing protein (plasmid) [Pontibacillus sp. ALD_SL1]|uniref:transglycosylase SLT domain-containing protein n=1 Tax=Pontibacillus sp. ALD_SL1 TaxID=2777185 RepID=UPI001A97C36F|nr:transglycosylase SLT domain-containing protein [Pontibacillus sp. ALD_SL1]QST02367.1 transglycosylase SLT domain-containing protein [Pontibacillus sp. ALD_SL1]